MGRAIMMLAMLVGIASAVPASPAPVRSAPYTVRSVDSDKTTVRVNNQAFADADIWVVRDGFRYRLGTASGNATTKFTVPGFIDRGMASMTFLVHPIGKRGGDRSEELLVSPGDLVELYIPPA